ncbi:MAG: glycosyltransferase family 2 protein [Actinomycetaceae bacterium]|nr:glycosyltransferase family 2 protein [Actinomycetaceae bacterium]
MPEICVLLPALNAASTIEAAVYSTLRALPAHSQILLLDDGSTDGTAQVAAQGADKAGRSADLVVIRNEKPGGVANGLNQLLSHADSRFIGRMDADDISLRGRFRACIKALNNGDDFVFTQIIRTRGRLYKPNAPLPLDPPFFPYELLLSNPATHPAMLATREAFDRLGGYRVTPAEDYDLWLRAATEKMRLRRLPHWGLLYRIHPGQVTQGADYLATSHTDSRQAQAYSDLALALVGTPLVRPALLPTVDPAERSRAITTFATVLTEHFAHLPGFQGFLLRRHLRSKIASMSSLDTVTKESGKE